MSTSRNHVSPAVAAPIIVPPQHRFDPHTFEARNDHVLLQLLGDQDMKVGSLHLPSAGDKTRPFGRVVAVGPGKAYASTSVVALLRLAIDLFVGDVVVFRSGTRVEEPGVGTFFVCREDDIVAVAERAKAATPTD